MTYTEKPIVGRVRFANGETQEFTDADEYLTCIRKELEFFATTGFSVPNGHTRPSGTKGGR